MKRYKKIFALTLFLLWDLGGLFAQFSNQNYIITTVPTTQVTDPTKLTDVSCNTVIQYYDGLGRPIETVQRGITPQKKDLVNTTIYDGIGREYQHWNPAPSANDNGTYMDINTFQATQKTFYNDVNPYRQTNYEPSPLNRIKEQYRAGAAWYTNSKKVTTAYGANTLNEVACFTVTNFTTSGQLQRTGYYATNTLYKTMVTDEDGKSVTEFKDKQGRVLMKRSSTNVDTYFVYNDLDQLCYVLPPLAADGLKDPVTYADDNDYLKKYGYLYKYDERGNCIYKKLPGCTPIYMIYDKANQLVLSQDGNQRKRLSANQMQWTVTKYDALGRVIFTGTMYRSETDTLQLYASIRSTLKTQQITESTLTTGIGYTANFFNTASALTVNYYDNYDGFLNLLSSDAKTQLTYVDVTGYDKRYPAFEPWNGQYGNCTGLLTGARTYLLDNSGNYTAAAMYYDYRGRIIQTRATNHLNGYEISYSALNFSGNPVKILKTHSINGTTPSVTELLTYTYDHAQRPLTTSHSLNNATAVVIASNAYDQLGRLAGKACHNAAESTNYTYNIQNWLTSITNSSWKEEVFYQDAPDNPMYNGNIAQSTWTYNRRPHRGYKYTYDDLNRLTQADYGEQSGLSVKQHLQDEYFSYDKMGNIKTIQRKSVGRLIDNLSFEYNGNQLKKVDDAGENGAWYGETAYTNYSYTALSDFSYDANGNMTSDLDKDIVTIKYNVLNLPEIIQFKNGNPMLNLYDAGGRKLRTKYYTLYSPVLMPVGATRTDYSSSNSSQRIDDYMGNMLYEGASSEAYHPLTKILTPEGYIDYTDRHYCYFKKDHLGSIREVGKHIGADRVVVQKTQYYPSGTPYWEGFKSGEQPFKFTGKELITMHGLNWQDYGARWLDNVKMQWTSVDPLAEKYYDVSPYVYCGNNPVRMVDPDGMNWYKYTGEDGKEAIIWQEGNAKSIELDGQSYSDIGETYTQQVDKNTSITYTQNEVTSITTNTMNKDEWVSQFSKPYWGETPASKACNKACDAMLANEDVKSAGMVIVVNNGGDGRAGTANGNATNATNKMSTALDFGVPTKVNVDYRAKSSSGDGMGDHFIVVQGKTEIINNGQVTGTTFNFYDPGTNYQNKGTSSNNTLSIMNRTLVGSHINNGKPIVVTSIRPSR